MGVILSKLLIISLWVYMFRSNKTAWWWWRSHL